MDIATKTVLFFSILLPSRAWFAPGQPLAIDVKPESGAVTLVLTDFLGKPFDAKKPADFDAATKVDLKEYFAAVDNAGTYLLYAVPKGGDVKQFVGTPLVIEVRADVRRDAPPRPQVTRVEPLRYAKLTTDQGEMTLAFYYDAAPNTVTSFLDLAMGGYYDGLTFHRIIPKFVIQGGDPLGDGTGGPGYRVNAEFNDRAHDLGVLSMAREGDPMERQGAMPRPEFADSAGSQFFICLGRVKHLDRRYAAFGRVVKGIEAVNAIAAVETDAETDRPKQPVVIKSVEILPVKAGANPYEGLLTADETK